MISTCPANSGGKNCAEAPALRSLVMRAPSTSSKTRRRARPRMLGVTVLPPLPMKWTPGEFCTGLNDGLRLVLADRHIGNNILGEGDGAGLFQAVQRRDGYFLLELAQGDEKDVHNKRSVLQEQQPFFLVKQRRYEIERQGKFLSAAVKMNSPLALVVMYPAAFSGLHNRSMPAVFGGYREPMPRISTDARGTALPQAAAAWAEYSAKLSWRSA